MILIQDGEHSNILYQTNQKANGSPNLQMLGEERKYVPVSIGELLEALLEFHLSYHVRCTVK